MSIAPTYKAVTRTFISIFRLADGKIAEDWWESDMIVLLRQLGIDPLKPH